MAKDSKFGTFGGVFTPSVLTILGVIMYLRLPWVVGSAGLYGALGIILVAHIISVSTGLSISSIATDKNVGAGGPYYIVSRSLGLPIGGTLGLALFVGLAFSISLYIIGFSESFLGRIGVDATPTAIRITGTVTLVALTIVTFISTAFAIKTQYIILLLIVLSLLAIFTGSPSSAAAAPHLQAAPKSPSLALVFGIFFPAVTGFTAGVNMSGDLRNPKKSIPRGTMAAIATGMAVYVGLAVFLAYRVPADQLMGNTEILMDIALNPWLVVAGIWGATLSSALGSILGAPRILQAVSGDGITPRIFAKGYGKAHEPRNALVLAFAIAEGGILIAELDAIARIVSMVFLATYGFLNVSCAIESWASPDFRPAFRIPKSVSVVGAVTCVVIMIQLDLLAMLGATVLMTGLFLYLQRRQLKLDSGDTWEGIWSSLIRSGLHRLSRETAQKRNWKPNILAFRPPGERSPEFGAIAASLVTGNGILTDFHLESRAKGNAAPARGTGEEMGGEEAGTAGSGDDDEDRLVGIFERRLAADDVFHDIGNVCRYHGFAALEPNTLLTEWALHSRDAEKFSRLLSDVSDLDFNVLLLAQDSERGFGEGKRIDVWWLAEAGNVGLSLTLLKFLTSSTFWQDAEIRFLLVSSDTANNDNLRSTMRRLLVEARVDGTVKVISDVLGERPIEDRMREESHEADLTLLGLPNADAVDVDFQERVDRVLERLGSVLLIRGSSAFPELLTSGREAAVSFLPPPSEDGSALELPDLELPETPDLAREASAMETDYQKLFGAFHEHGVKRVYGRGIELVRAIKASVDKHLSADKALTSGNPRRQRKAFNRVQSSLLLECQELLTRFAENDLPDLRGILEGRIDAFLHDESVTRRAKSREEIAVERDPKDFKADDKDAPAIRAFKRRRRWMRLFGRKRYLLPIGALEEHYFDRAVVDVLQPTVRSLVTETHQLLVHLGKILNSSKLDLDDATEEGALARLVERQREHLSEHLDDLVQSGKSLVNRQQWSLLMEARKIGQGIADDVDRLDVRRFTRDQRKPLKEARAARSELTEAPALWLEHQSGLVDRAKLALRVSAFHHRLASIAHREKQAIVLQVKNGALSECEELVVQLDAFLGKLREGADASQLKIHLELENRLDPKVVIDNLVEETTSSIEELPETIETLSDESIQALEEGKGDETDTVELPVRRIAQFLVESELIGGLQEVLAKILPLEQRALGVAQDVVRLVSFQLAEAEASTDDDAGDLAEQMRPVIENGLERTRAEVEKLQAVVPELENVFDEKLEVVIEGSNAYELTGTSEKLEQHIRVAQGKRAVSGVRGLLRRGLASARDAMVQAIYRRSAGLLLARRLKEDAKVGGQAVDRVLALVGSSSPRPDAVEDLPFYYRQLFLGQSAINETFWVGREEQMAKARLALDAFRRGAHGALIVTGERGSGKTALCQRITAELLGGRKVHRVHARPGGTTARAHFERALGKAFDLDGDANELLRAQPDGTVVILDDLELWWDRGPEGMEIVKLVLELIERHGKRVLFILGVGSQARRMIDRFAPLSDQALAVLECGPMPAEALKSIITLRHASTGMKFELGSREEDSLGELRLARLFSDYFDYSNGFVGTALRAWVAHVERVRDNTIEVQPPSTLGWERVDALRTEWVALLVQLLLHKQVSVRRLRVVSGLEARDFRRDLDTLLRMGLVVENRRRIVEINPFVHHIVLDRFAKRGLVA